MRGRRRRGPPPLSNALVLKNATVPAALVENPPPGAGPDGLVRADVFIRDGKFEKVLKPGHTMHYTIWDLGGEMVFPCFVDCHTHIDKGHIAPRAPNPDGTFMSALAAVGADRAEHWRAYEVASRMYFSLRCAFVHGTAALRTHIDSIPPQEEISWPVFEYMRSEWEGQIALQGVSLVTLELVREQAWFAKLADRVAAAKGVLGAATFMLPDLDTLLDDVVRAAMDRGLDLDFHADETLDPDAAALDRIAEAVLRNGFEGRVLVGHCCSLARQADDQARRTLDKVAKAGLSIVSLPMCNLYLQDRRGDGTTPRLRGVTLLHEMKARGIPVAVASDNTRDPFYAYGDLDMLEVFREATRILHFDHPFADWPAAVGATPAKAMGLPQYGKIAPGNPAEFIIFSARDWSELLSRPQSDRRVYRNGRLVTEELPEYSELDELVNPAAPRTRMREFAEADFLERLGSFK
jgi:cytosine deaminase